MPVERWCTPSWELLAVVLGLLGVCAAQLYSRISQYCCLLHDGLAPLGLIAVHWGCRPALTLVATHVRPSVYIDIT